MLSRTVTGLRLRPGSRIGVIGGGPAGAFFALHLLRRASQAGLPLAVTIFESKDFSSQGPTGCNRCAGILSSRLLHAMEAQGWTPPAETIMARISGYRLIMNRQQFLLPPPTPASHILSVYRGSGPRLGSLAPGVSFDGWLLGLAEGAGAGVVRVRVQAVHATAGDIQVQVGERREPFDLVVLAAGVNGGSLPLHGLPYRPPRRQTMAQDEVVWPPSWGDSPGRSAEVYVYSGFSNGLLFAALVPKGPFVNVNLLGHRLPQGALARFLDYLQEEHGGPQPAAATPARLCGCRPRIATSAADRFFDDRFVAVGDAAVTRLYKDGIGSAFLTAERAADTVVTQGISCADFARTYQPLCRELDRDNRAGHLLFRIWRGVQHNRWARQAWLRALKAEEASPPDRRPCHRALWGMFTGDSSYRQIVRLLSSRSVLVAVVRALAAEAQGRSLHSELQQEKR